MTDREALAKYKPLYVLCVPAILIMMIYVWSSGDGLQTADNYLIGRDFVNYWTGPVAWASGQVLDIFTLESYRQIQAELFGNSLPLHNWSYPPSMLLLLLPLAFFPYLAAYIFWVAAGMSAYLWAAMRPPYTLTQGFFFALAPASLLNIGYGQNGFMTAALFLGALRTMRERPIVSGILFGLLTIKPQLGILIPFALLASRQWRVIGAACVSAALLAGLSVLLFGVQAWTLYLTETSQIQMKILNEFTPSYVMMITPFTGFRLMGLSADMSYLAHWLFAIPAALAVIWAWARPARDELRHALLITCTFLASPYGFNYDLPVMTGAVWLTACYIAQANKPLSHHTLLVAVLAMPVFCMGFSSILVPIGPIALSAMAIYLVRQIAAERGAGRAMAASPFSASD